MRMNEHILVAADAFSLGKVQAAQKIQKGLINDSYHLETNAGKYIMQALNTTLWDERVIDDYQAVQRYLRTSGLFVPVLLTTQEGKAAFQHKGRLWRCFEYVPHDSVETPTPTLAHEAGAMLGRFHMLMSRSSFTPTFTLLGFHDTPAIKKRLATVACQPYYCEKAAAVKHGLAFLERQIEEHYLPTYANTIVIHGDPKLNNFLFRDGRAVALLDLDTMMVASPLLDIGDAFRSWCRRKPATAEFLPEVFEAAYAGYCTTAPYQYTVPGVKSAMGLITLELAARYLIDYFEESYFSLKKEKYSSRAEQNLIRARRYIEYYHNFISYAAPYYRDE